jgi:hypothetical protein
MAKGKHRDAAAKRRELENKAMTYEQLETQFNLVVEENERLRNQLDQDHIHHAFQIARMHEQTIGVTSPRIQELEEEVLRLKKALRGL